MENIKEKIQKLLNLATSDNEYEASMALAKATELMNKWNLDKETVLGQKIEKIDIEMPFYKWTTENQKLVAILSKLCDGYCLYATGNKKFGHFAKIVLSGRPRDLENFRYLFDFLDKKLRKESEKYKLSIRVSGINNKDNKNSMETKSFRIGFLRKIEEKLEVSKKEFFTTNKSLVVINSEAKRKEAEEYLLSIVGKVKEQKRSVTIIDKHMEAGKKVAEEIDLNMAIRGQKKVYMLEDKKY